MSFVNAFKPSGPTVLVGSSSVQVTTNDGCYAIDYRIRNTSGADAYISWAPQVPLNGSVTVPTATAPTSGSPSNNTLGIASDAVEVITLPANAWFIASGTFEVTPGEGL